MKIDFIHALTHSLESHSQQTDHGVEFWLARDIQHLLGYSKWENFLNVVSKARTACEVSGHPVLDHFPDIRKMVVIGSDSQREVDDVRKVERRLTAEAKKSLTNPDSIDP